MTKILDRAPRAKTVSAANGFESLPIGNTSPAEKAVPDENIFFLILDARDRVSIATTIERLIGVLDALDPDPDLEPDADSEPWLGWRDAAFGRSITDCVDGARHDDREDEDEHGGDIVDEPHDQLDQGDDEPLLGWVERDSQGVRMDGACFVSMAGDPDDCYPFTGRPLDFDGSGYRDGDELLRGIGRRGCRVAPALW